MNYYRRIWRSKKKGFKAVEYFWRLRTITASLKKRKSTGNDKQSVFPFLFRQPILRDSNTIISPTFFSNNYSLTVILFLLLFVFHKIEYKDSIIIGSIFKFPYTSKDNPENPKQVGKTSWQLPGSTIPPYSSSWYSKINMINKSYSRQTKNN